MNSWAPLPFFKVACREALDKYLTLYGFHEVSINTPIGIVYRNDDIALTIDYLLEDAPRYRVQIGVGFLTSQGGYSREVSLGLWYFIPQKQSQMAYWEWTWSDSVQLVNVLNRICETVFPAYLVPLIQDPREIQKALLRWKNEQAAKREQHVTNSKVKQALRAFQEQRYAEALKIYQELNDVDVSLIDRKRIDYALKQMRKI